LPGGLNPAWFKSKWYSGSYNVTKNREVHYIFVESQWQPEKDPLIVVMNGGTGAASTYLAFQGIGPVYLRSDSVGGFIEMNNTWCNNASVLFIDNPAGTGYSWADRKIDYFGNDYHMKKEALSFLTQFFKDFPEYLKNSLYLAGFNYGGVYAPLLALEIHYYNLEQAMKNGPQLPLKGLILQNGIVDYRFDPNTHSLDQFYAFGIIP
jgi:carboxypeptidase C (cathepsin A)